MTITLKWPYIKYDVDQETWKTAKCHITDPALAESQNEAQTGIDTFDIHYCKRKIEQALMNLQDLLHKFFVSYTHTHYAPDGEGGTDPVYVTDPTSPDADGMGSDDSEDADDSLLADDEDWQINLSFDGRRNINAKLLASVLHKYVVLYILQEWAKMALPTMEQNYIQRGQLEEVRIKQICYRKEAPVLES